MKQRRQVQLPKADELFLNGLNCRWETIVDGGMNWVLLHERLLPTGFVQKLVDIAINLTPGYPPATLDMAYFFPALSRTDGRPIPRSDSFQAIDGKSWQRWSRHRTAENPWVPGEDDLASHYCYVQSWLHDEPRR